MYVSSRIDNFANFDHAKKKQHFLGGGGGERGGHYIW